MLWLFALLVASPTQSRVLFVVLCSAGRGHGRSDSFSAAAQAVLPLASPASSLDVSSQQQPESKDAGGGGGALDAVAAAAAAAVAATSGSASAKPAALREEDNVNFNPFSDGSSECSRLGSGGVSVSSCGAACAGFWVVALFWCVRHDVS